MLYQSALDKQTQRNHEDLDVSAWVHYPDPEGLQDFVYQACDETIIENLARTPSSLSKHYFQIPNPSQQFRYRLATLIDRYMHAEHVVYDEIPTISLSPTEAFDQLLDMPAHSTLHDLQDRTAVPLCLLYEWMEHFDWENRRARALAGRAISKKDYDIQKLLNSGMRAAEIFNIGLAGGGVFSTGGLMPRPVYVPAFDYNNGEARSFQSVTQFLSHTLTQANGRAAWQLHNKEFDAQESRLFHGLDDEALLAEMGKFLEREKRVLEHEPSTGGDSKGH